MGLISVWLGFFQFSFFIFFSLIFFVSGLWNWNRTELNIFLNILIDFFHDSIFFPRFNQFFTHSCSLVTLKNESQMNKKNFTSINFIFFGMVKEQNYLHWTFLKNKNSLTPRLIFFYGQNITIQVLSLNIFQQFSLSSLRIQAPKHKK